MIGLLFIHGALFNLLDEFLFQKKIYINFDDNLFKQFDIYR